MASHYENYKAVEEVCKQIKKCMKSAHDLSNGGPDIPSLMEAFQRDVGNLQRLLTTGPASKLIDDELKKIDGEKLLDFSKMKEEDLHKLISNEFKSSQKFNLERFVSTTSILRAIQEPEYKKQNLYIKSSKEVSEILAKNSHEYKSSLIKCRENSSITRKEKKKDKRNISGGIFNTLCGVSFLACNTLTRQMKASASFARKHFKTAETQLSARDL